MKLNNNPFGWNEINIILILKAEPEKQIYKTNP